MARYLGPKMKRSRRYGQPLLFTAKEAKVLQRRGYPPGQHGPAKPPRLSGYGLQLREKQKARIIYGLLERQFRKYYTEALRQTGDTGEILLQILERRLDNVVYRLGFAISRAQARQLVGHGHIFVNQHLVDIPSFRVRPGDVIQLRPQSAQKKIFIDLAKSLENKEVVSWIQLDKITLIGKILSLPGQADLEQSIKPQLIIEYYSR